MAEPEQELYEELANDAIYEDLPDSAYDDAPLSPPPLPSTPIPSLPSPAHKAPPPPAFGAPPLPTRAVGTAVTRNQPNNNLQKPGKAAKAATMKPRPGKPPPPVKGKGGGGGGIDISEIMKKARQRTGSTSAIMDLETKIGEKKDDESAHVAPWANQLRKPKVPVPAKEPVKVKESEEDKTPPWVKRKVENEDFTSESRPTVPSKPPVANESGPDGRSSPTGDDNRPPWLKQRERQVQLARTVAGTDREKEKPAVVPKPAAKPPPMAPKPASKPPPTAPASKPPPTIPAPKPTSDQPPPPSPRKARPVPTPKTNNTAEEKQASGESPPTQSVGVLAKAKMFAEAGSKPAIAPKTAARPPPVKPHGVGTENSTVVAPRVEKKSPTPPPIPTRESSMSQVSQPRSPSPIPEDTPPPPPPPSSRPPSAPEPDAPPPVPASRPPPISTRPPPPDMPPPPTSPPPPFSQPPTLPPPPPPSEPPGPPSLPDRNLPKPPLPLPPSFRPPPSLPATRAQPTPPTGTVMKFRRRPLKSVDPSKPPPLPQPNAKPAKFPVPPPSSAPPSLPPVPTAAGSEAETSGEGDEPEEIYEDTVAGALDQDVPEELYEDIGQIQTSKPLMPPPLPPPPLPPSIPPPSIRPPPPTVVETPEMNYETDPNLQQNGMTPHEDVAQELYEDLNPDDSLLNSPAPSVTTLTLPPSPSQNSLTPGTSPTLDRKQKLSREQKKQQKEEEKKKKEMKKKEEMKAKNRLKSLRAFKEFKLPNDVQSLFGVVVQEDHPRAKDHMAVSKGEQVYVLLINHPKLPNDRYFIEKDDGTMGFVMKSICVRMVYLVQQNEPTPATDLDGYEDKDIYEQLPTAEEEEDGLHGIPPPALPPPNTLGTVVNNFPLARFPAPSQAPPPPPPDEPQDNYEYLPEQQGSY